MLAKLALLLIVYILLERQPEVNGAAKAVLHGVSILNFQTRTADAIYDGPIHFRLACVLTKTSLFWIKNSKRFANVKIGCEVTPTLKLLIYNIKLNFHHKCLPMQINQTDRHRGTVS